MREIYNYINLIIKVGLLVSLFVIPFWFLEGFKITRAVGLTFIFLYLFNKGTFVAEENFKNKKGKMLIKGVRFLIIFLLWLISSFLILSFLKEGYHLITTPCHKGIPLKLSKIYII